MLTQSSDTNVKSPTPDHPSSHRHVPLVAVVLMQTPLPEQSTPPGANVSNTQFVLIFTPLFIDARDKRKVTVLAWLSALHFYRANK